MNENAYPTDPPTAEVDGAQARLFASLVQNMLENHEQKWMRHLERLTSLVDLLVHDARGLHLQAASHSVEITRMKQELSFLKEKLIQIPDLLERVIVLEKQIQQLLSLP